MKNFIIVLHRGIDNLHLKNDTVADIDVSAVVFFVKFFCKIAVYFLIYANAHDIMI